MQHEHLGGEERALRIALTAVEIYDDVHPSHFSHPPAGTAVRLRPTSGGGAAQIMLGHRRGYAG
ncbi:hypothetical protein Stube_68420 [Streptomyces tubercidicus]|uniref:Uncharacterized protein n=1 Tax=Streptomyces tubercidicus TaxID=47759 RepID=A0A640V1W5_9ACTN|nr:hypothetical protein Stube_68420 [Streptomyces tubercidicus]